tara:strand:- start:4855 stop:5073 length:219 start_codon:yes stop_codon:yes gene_type:complete
MTPDSNKPRIIEGTADAAADDSEAHVNRRGPIVEDSTVVGGIDADTGAPVIRPKNPDGNADSQTEATDPGER